MCIRILLVEENPKIFKGCVRNRKMARKRKKYIRESNFPMYWKIRKKKYIKENSKKNSVMFSLLLPLIS